MTEQIEKPTSRNIPLPIQREVRKRCGFGCVICGMPLYEYEHMEGWAVVRRHVADEITRLCDQHHREKTNGLLPIEAVRRENSSPYNIREGVSKPYDLHFEGAKAEVVIGGNSFSAENRGDDTCLVPLSIDGIPLISFILTEKHLLLNLIIMDEFNNPILNIKNNHLYYSIAPWDVQLVGTKLTIREASRKILIEIEFEPPNRVIVSRGRFLANGVEVLIRPENILITNNAIVISGCHIRSIGGLIIGHHSNPLPGFMSIPNIARYLGDRTEALRFEKECNIDH